MSEAERPPVAGPLTSDDGSSRADAAIDAVTHLSAGAINVKGRMPWSSNATFLVDVDFEGTVGLAVYKPGRGERPLWDFPDGLYRREVAAFELGAWLGWDLVPETILRLDAPYGTGSLQRFVDADFEQHYFTLLEDPAHHEQLRRMAVFDILANNADRKGGHVLTDATAHLWGIDNGLCFHDEPKLRTVIWDFAGEPVADALLGDVERVAAAGVDGAPTSLQSLLHPAELEAVIDRAGRLLRRPRLPEPSGTHRDYPWPMV